MEEVVATILIRKGREATADIRKFEGNDLNAN